MLQCGALDSESERGALKTVHSHKVSVNTEDARVCSADHRSTHTTHGEYFYIHLMRNVKVSQELERLRIKRKKGNGCHAASDAGATFVLCVYSHTPSYSRRRQKYLTRL